MRTMAVVPTIVLCGIFVAAQIERPVTPAQPSPDVQGTWLGTLDAGGVKLRVAFNISQTANGLTATMDSLDQGGKGIPVTTVTYKRSILAMAVNAVGGVYHGDVERLTCLLGDGKFALSRLPQARHSIYPAWRADFVQSSTRR